MKSKIKSIFVSDIHLGSKFSQVKKLNQILEFYDFENIFLIGDIFDGWKMKKTFFWDESKNIFIQKILNYSKNKVNVVYLTGNHDEFLRKYNINQIGNILVCDEYIYKIHGRKILILHGDFFDNLCNTFGLLYYLGDSLYTVALHFNKFTNFIRKKLGFRYYPISSLLKRKVKMAIKAIDNFEYAASQYCKEKKCSDIIIGHIHHPEIYKDIDGIKYHNTGDFVESCSFIIEKYNGELELIFC